MRRLLTLAATITLVGTLTAAPHFSSAQAASAWLTFHGGPGRDGTANSSGPASTPLVTNNYTLSGLVHVSPVVDGAGNVYIGDDTGTVYAFDPHNGTTPTWTYTAGARISATPGLSPDGKKLFVGAYDGNVTALNTATGAKLWTVNLGSPVQSSPVTSADGATVYLAGSAGRVEGISTADGSEQWKIPIGGSIPGSITLGQDGSVIYVATSISIVYALPALGLGAGRGSTPYYLDSPPLGSPAVDAQGNIYVTTTTGSVMSFTPGSSTARWTAPSATHTPSTSTPAIANGLVVVGNSNGYVYGLNSSTGVQQWQYHTGGNVSSSAAITTGNGEIYVGSGDGKLYALRSAGDLSWSRTIGVGVQGSPAIAPDGSVWIASDSGNLLHFTNTILPPPAPSTNTPAPTSTATATPAVTATTAPTSTPTQVPQLPLELTLKLQVAPGQPQIITVHSAASTEVQIRVDFPNGDRRSGKVTTDASGVGVYRYKQGGSKVTHNKSSATVTASVGSGTAANSKTATYKISFGKIDVSAEPRAQRPGGKVDIYVHARSGVHVRARLFFPNGTVKRFNSKAGPKGFGHWTYTVGKRLTKGTNTNVTVSGDTIGLHPDYSAKTTFTITK